MSIHESGEMYLETVYILSQKSQSVRSIDVAEYMGFSRPSVSRAIGLLKKDGFIMIDDQGFLKLTEAGENTAKRMYERHTLLSRLLMNITATEDACRIEHYISEKTFEAIKEHVKKFGSKE